MAEGGGEGDELPCVDHVPLSEEAAGKIIPIRVSMICVWRTNKYTLHPKYKAQLIDQEVADNPANLNTMPTEVLEEILSYISFKQRIRLQRTSKHIKEITVNKHCVISCTAS